MKKIITVIAAATVLAGLILTLSECDGTLAVTVLSKIAGCGAMYAGAKVLLWARPDLKDDRR